MTPNLTPGLGEHLRSLLLSECSGQREQGWELYLSLGEQGRELLVPWRPVRLRDDKGWLQVARRWLPGLHIERLEAEEHDIGGGVKLPGLPVRIVFSSHGEAVIELRAVGEASWEWSLPRVYSEPLPDHIKGKRRRLLEVSRSLPVSLPGGAIVLADTSRPGIVNSHRGEVRVLELLVEPLLEMWMASGGGR